MKILFIGDVVGEEGAEFALQHLSSLRHKIEPDFVIVNAENASKGKGVTPQIAYKFKQAGVHCLTSGNHIWDIRKREILSDSKWSDYILRPANYPENLPGRGFMKLRTEKHQLLVINLQGTVFMEALESPFHFMEKMLVKFRMETKNILVDFHAEATSEKLALAHFLDGKVSAVFGTHTHVQTADEQILPNGTGYITDVGMTGPYDSVIGLKKEEAIKRFKDKIPYHYKLADGPLQFNAVVLEVDDASGKSKHIERIYIRQ
ncbi:MAG: TIGR00282 family metallophosphoesterase [Methanobacteriota archaeon]|nr:MAG: TIGR00282 family metallophosphoesterase [Euryarchaeota archaeon]